MDNTQLSPQSFKMLPSVQLGLGLTEQAKDISVLMGLESLGAFKVLVGLTMRFAGVAE